MKTKIPTALLALTLALLPSTVRADGAHSGSNTNLCDEQLVARIVLTATTNAPAGAGGIARLKSETEDGVTETVLRLRLKGLLAGDYLLEITTQSDGAINTLGQFTVGATFHVAVNGSSVGTTVRSNRKGRLVLKKLPSQQSQIRSVRLMDSQGKSAVSTSF